jgi:hypothetical protein
MQLDLAAIDVEAFFRESVGNVARRHRTEKLIVFAGAALECNRHAFELRSERLCSGLFFGGAANCRGLHLLDNFFVAFRRLYRQLAWQQIIAAIALRDFDYIAA